jgi:hypothetical protein
MLKIGHLFHNKLIYSFVLAILFKVNIHVNNNVENIQTEPDDGQDS